ncbi:MAG: hypothetical protein ACODAQ_12850, partial [Phycisphaeraceae bacterium]
LIRLRHIRPRLLPAALGLRSENAAHRIAVEWEQDGDVREGVYIPRRDTDSCLNTVAGGRVFPGVHHRARFDVRETPQRFEIHMRSRDEETWLDVLAHATNALPDTSVFDSVQTASAFFEAGSLGYSATEAGQKFDGIELRCRNWHVEPLSVEHVASSFFSARTRFDENEVIFDHALLMRGIEHEWHAREPLYCGDAALV